MKGSLCGVGLAVILCLGIATTARSQNLLQNATFDSGLAPWFSGTFSTLDAMGSASSGSIQGTNAASTPFTFESLVSECVPVVAGKVYERDYDYRFVASPGVTGNVSLAPGWYSGPNCSGFLFTSGSQSTALADGAWHPRTDAPLTAPAAAQSANLRLEIIKFEGGGSVTAGFDNVVFKLAGTCAPLPDILCLNNGRFQVEANWQTLSNAGRSRVFKLTSDTGYLWFFGPDNVEVVVKVLDACSFAGSYWVFAGGLTDQGVDITVTDTKTGATKSYANIRGVPFAPVQDTSAFATCP